MILVKRVLTRSAIACLREETLHTPKAHGDLELWHNVTSSVTVSVKSFKLSNKANWLHVKLESSKSISTYGSYSLCRHWWRHVTSDVTRAGFCTVALTSGQTNTTRFQILRGRTTFTSGRDVRPLGGALTWQPNTRISLHFFFFYKQTTSALRAAWAILKEDPRVRKRELWSQTCGGPAPRVTWNEC